MADHIKLDHGFIHSIQVFGQGEYVKAEHAQAKIDELSRNLRHWREECGKLHAKIAESDHVNDQLRQRLGLGEAENERLERVIKKLQTDLLAWEITAKRIEREEAEKAYDPTVQPFDEPFRHVAGVAEQSGAGAPETSVRCGAPAAKLVP